MPSREFVARVAFALRNDLNVKSFVPVSNAALVIAISGCETATLWMICVLMAPLFVSNFLGTCGTHQVGYGRVECRERCSSTRTSPGITARWNNQYVIVWIGIRAALHAHLCGKSRNDELVHALGLRGEIAILNSFE
jgi:hypothetical protein